MRCGVSDASNLEQGGVRFSFLVIIDHCCGGITSVLNNSVDSKSRLLEGKYHMQVFRFDNYLANIYSYQ